jgi:S-adenosylmethionine:tRNA ribosyltransferase-isomerase
MKLSDFDYTLPETLIASYPLPERTQAKLLSVNRATGSFSHRVFRDIPQFLKAGDVLVLNNTKVIPARLLGRKESGGKIEALLLRKENEKKWSALIRPNKRIQAGAKITFGENGVRLRARLLNPSENGSAERLLEFEENLEMETLEKIGHVPLPPYLNREDKPLDREYYQTVFARKEGAVAAPTAGLHFDKALLHDLENKGIEIVFVTLHVGYGTFRPIRTENLAEYQMEEEEFEVTEGAALQINEALEQGWRIIACGTTSVRVLESAVNGKGRVVPRKGSTRLFIYPPYEFKVTKGLITNFHLPKSSLLLLVAAFLGDSAKLFSLYQEAIREQYRFYSYGDAMVIL